MSGTSERTVAEPEKFVFEERVDTLNVRIVGGAVNVVGTDDGPARVEVTEIDGPPLRVNLRGSTLTVTYEDLPWRDGGSAGSSGPGGDAPSPRKDS